MIIKLHIPKSLRAGSGISSLKQFVLSLIATSISIALTFGTAGVLDHNKKQKEKRQMVMMIMYDLHNSLKMVEQADSMIRKSIDVQLAIAEDTSLYKEMRFSISLLLPKIDFTVATEHIFSSSIETINTLGNVLFTEDVAEFYLKRQQYKTEVCDSLLKEVSRETPSSRLKGLLDIDFYVYSWISEEFLTDMQRLFAECKQLMDVTDKDLEKYKKKRESLEPALPQTAEKRDSIINEITSLQQRLLKAKEKINWE